MSRPGQKPLEGLIAAISGLIAVYPDKTINTTAETDDLLTRLRKGGL